MIYLLKSIVSFKRSKENGSEPCCNSTNSGFVNGGEEVVGFCDKQLPVGTRLSLGDCDSLGTLLGDILGTWLGDSKGIPEGDWVGVKLRLGEVLGLLLGA
jgi:hypothetical protein